VTRAFAAAAIVFALALPTAVQTLPAPSELGTRFATNEGDPVLLMWTLQYETEALVHDPSRVFAGNIFWPREDAIAWSDNLLAYVPVFGSVWYLAGRNPVLAYNVVAFLGYLIGAIAVFLLARHLLDDSLAALVAAAVFSFSTFRSVAIGHVQLAGFFFVPLALLFLMRFLESRRYPDAIALGVSAAGTWLITSYYAVLLALVVVPFVAVWLIQRRFRPGARFWRGLLVAAATAGLLVGPTLVPYVRLQRAGLFGRTDVFQVEGSGLVRFPPSLVYRDLPDDWHVRGDKNALFPGLVLTGLVALAVVRRNRAVRRNPGYVVPLAAGCVACGLLMLGPDQWGPLDWPYRAMRAAVPGVSSLRELTRFWVYPLLCLALIAGVGAIRLTADLRARFPARTHMRALTVGVVVALACLELLYRPPFTTIDLSRSRLAAYHALDELPAGPVTEVPVVSGPSSPFVLAPRQLRSLVDGNPRVEGYSGNFPPEFSAMQSIASAFPAPAAIDGLRRYGVRYVIVHGGVAPCLGAFGPDEMALLRSTLPTTAGVARVIEAGSDLVVELAPARVDRSALPSVRPIDRIAQPCASN
jgi:hypothetical protein